MADPDILGGQFNMFSGISRLFPYWGPKSIAKLGEAMDGIHIGSATTYYCSHYRYRNCWIVLEYSKIQGKTNLHIRQEKPKCCKRDQIILSGQDKPRIDLNRLNQILNKLRSV